MPHIASEVAGIIYLHDLLPTLPTLPNTTHYVLVTLACPVEVRLAVVLL